MKRMFFIAVVFLFLGTKSVLVASDNDKPNALCISPAHQSLAILQRLASEKERPASSILLSGRKPSSKKDATRRHSLENPKKDASEY